MFHCRVWGPVVSHEDAGGQQQVVVVIMFKDVWEG